MIIVNADLGNGNPVAVTVVRGRITAVGPAPRRSRGHTLVDARGGAVVAGLHDQHVHLRAAAAARLSVPVGPPHVATPQDLAAALRRADRAAAPGAWIRAVGYHASVAGRLELRHLDALVPGRPVRVQHRSGVEWVLNSAAVREVGLDGATAHGIERDASGRPTGRLVRLDAWLGARVPREPPDLAAVAADAAARGVTAFTDATPVPDGAELGLLSEARQSGALPQHLTVMTAPGVDPEALPGLRLGPVKVLLDDDALPEWDALVSVIEDAHGTGRCVALHAVTRVQAVYALAALRTAGARPGDRIEHGAVLPDGLLEDVRRLGVTVVTNPGFVTTRGDDYLREVDPDDLPLLYRLRSLKQAGVAVAAGTDAPYGDIDPWPSIAAAVRRRTASGAALGRRERVTVREALALFQGGGHRPTSLRRVAVGHPGDLCVLRTPWAGLTTAELHRPGVAATIIAGRVVRAQP